jgi:hypothetical protein
MALTNGLDMLKTDELAPGIVAENIRKTASTGFDTSRDGLQKVAELALLPDAVIRAMGCTRDKSWVSIFRKRGSLFGNLLRLSLTGTGIGISVGMRAFGAGISSSGRHYVSASLPGTGVYLRHYAKRHRTDSATLPVLATLPWLPPHPVHRQIQRAAYSMGYTFGWLLILTPFALLAWLVWLGLR